MGVSPASTKSILTWKQVIGEENMSNIVPCAKDLYRWIGEHTTDGVTTMDGTKEGVRIYIYEVHDGKMIYNLTEHSMWNRKYYPFLLCGCLNGNGVVNPDHVCTFLTDKEIAMYFAKSLVKFQEAKTEDRTYNEKRHRDYCDKHLKGITHFGFDPYELLRSNCRFDVFHLRAQMTRKLLDHLRKFIRKYSSAIQCRFSQMLLPIWGEFKVNHWNCNKPFAKFKGPELLDFIVNTSIVTDFITKEFGADKEAVDIVEYLTLWASLTKFMVITDVGDKVGDKSVYCIKVKLFTQNVKKFYKVGARTFLSKNYVGDQENLYSHVLRFYIPQFADITFKRHGMGVGIFTMQGFEHRNKESKFVFKNHTNQKGNVAQQTIGRLFDSFLN